MARARGLLYDVCSRTASATIHSRPAAPCLTRGSRLRQFGRHRGRIGSGIIAVSVLRARTRFAHNTWVILGRDRPAGSPPASRPARRREKTARIASSAATSPPFMSHAPRPNTLPSLALRVRSGRGPAGRLAGRHHVRVGHQQRAASAGRVPWNVPATSGSAVRGTLRPGTPDPRRAPPGRTSQTACTPKPRPPASRRARWFPGALDLAARQRRIAQTAAGPR